MPRHPSPVEAPLELKETRASAATKIRSRIEKGLKLKEQKIDSDHALESFEKEYQKWNDYNESLLRALFTTDAAVVEYAWSIRTGAVIDQGNPYARYRRRVDAITQYITALESLADRLEVIALAGGTKGELNVSPADFHAAVWKLIHPMVSQVAKQRFADGHYADAVEAALKALSSEVKQIFRAAGGPDIDGVSLMQTAFSPNKPRIVLADLSTQSGKNMQRGYMELFTGAMSAIRNPKAHENVLISPERALHFLFLASMLWTTLDNRV